MKLKHLLFLLATVLVAYWQITFLQLSLKYDMMDCWLPWRHFYSQALHNGVLPLWNPYQHWGIPFYADQQVPWFYPENIILSILHVQNNYTLHYLFIGYTVLAGAGLYLLIDYLYKNKKAAITGALIFALSGFFVGHAQHFRPLISAAWVPFIVWSYLKLLDKPDLKNMLRFVLLLFLNISGGNHTFTILLSYLLLTILIFKVIEKRKEKDVFKKYIIQHVAGLAILIVLSLPILMAIFESMPYVTRLNGMTYEQSAMQPFSPQSFLSLLLPFTTANDTAFFTTDRSMSNWYIGILFLPFVLFGALGRKTKLENTLVIFAAVYLLAALGSYSPVHRFFHTCLPMMNVFRMPAYFAYFSMLIFIVIGSGYLGRVFFSEEPPKRIGIFYLTAFIFFAVMLLIANQKIYVSEIVYWFQKLKFNEFVLKIDFWQRIFIQSFIQAGILSAAVTIRWLFKYKSYQKYLFLSLLLIDLVLALQLNIYSTAVSKFKPKDIHDFVLSRPEGYPIPDLTPIDTHIDAKEGSGPLWRNTCMLAKKNSRGGFSSYQINKNKDFDTLGLYYEQVHSYPLLWVGDSIAPLTELNAEASAKGVLYVEDSVYHIMERKAYEASDNLISTVTVTAYSPNRIEAEVTSNKAACLTLQQTNFPGWHIVLNGKEIRHFESNLAFMSFPIPAGKSTVICEFKKPHVLPLALLSFGMFLLLTGYLAVSTCKSEK